MNALAGRRIVVTRPRGREGLLVALLEARGAEVWRLATIAIEPAQDPRRLRCALARLGDFDWLVLSSASGVDAVLEEVDAGAFAGVSLCAIGPATAARLEFAGVAVDLVPDRYTSEGIIEAMRKKGVAGKRILLARADIAPGDLPAGLERLGARVETVVAYRTVPGETEGHGDLIGRIEGGEADAITFTSSSTVRAFCRMTGSEDLGRFRGRTRLASIGPVTSRTIVQMGGEVGAEARQSTVEGLVRALEEEWE